MYVYLNNCLIKLPKSRDIYRRIRFNVYVYLRYFVYGLI